MSPHVDDVGRATTIVSLLFAGRYDSPPGSLAAGMLLAAEQRMPSIPDWIVEVAWFELGLAGIFIFGGSTMWGTGARDDYTIASWLSRLLGEKHIAAHVTNFGEGGYLSMQELIALEDELEADNVPDLVVFLDGVNDVFAAFQNGAPGIPQNEGNRVREFNIDQRIYREAVQTWFKDSAVFAVFGHPPVPGPPPNVDLNELGEAVTTHYAAIVTMINRLAQAYHFRTRFYWQPVIFTKQHLTAYEHGELEKQGFLTAFYQSVYGRMRNQGQVKYMGDLFADDPNPYFIDFCHLTEAGNQRIAGAMVDDVAAALAAAPN